MKKIFLVFVCATALLSSDEYDCFYEAPPYDADLFRRDEQVFSGHLSFLYWRVEEGGLDYALKMQHAPAPGIGYAQGEYERATFDGDPGFRAALGFFRALHYWEIWFQYTRMTSRGEDTVYAPRDPARFLVGTWPEDGPLSRATSHIHLNYNVGDFLADRFVNPNPHLRARFLGGATIAWINQNWMVRYYQDDTVSSQIQNRWKYIAGGLRIGSSFDWFCGYDLYLSGGVTFATLLGSYHNIARQTVHALDLPIRDAHYFDIRPTFAIQAMFGLSWQKNFCANRVEAFAGYEINTWFNLAESYRSTPGSAMSAKETIINSALLCLQGLTARVSVDF
ncbi:MAG TPA: Lpg1974 family pore-forming outer membrane protein [Chlamydiales bacterium]|nr:Lpg1974 family pore-forming outer membrane protein [Chlamydiales bacterium]